MGSSLVLIFLLSIMEISFSFDNAVVNASVLGRLPKKLQAIFLTWGILVSVFLVRLVLPSVIVACSSGLEFTKVIHLALDPAGRGIYKAYLLNAHTNIAVFGGTFLLLTFLSFLFDAERKEYWVDWLERTIAKALKASPFEIDVLICLMVIVPIVYMQLPLLPAFIGIGLFFFMGFLKDYFSPSQHAVTSGILGFIYLELLDASFSLDGIIGAFSISSDIITVMIGLGVGSLCIRFLTVYMVKNKTLEAFKYLEHGAHYSIGALGALMIATTQYSIPEVVTGLIGVTFILLALISSEVEAHRVNS